MQVSCYVKWGGGPSLPVAALNSRTKVVDGLLEALFERNKGVPTKPFAGAGNVRLALAGIVLWQRFVGDLAFGRCEPDDEPGEVEHRHFGRVTDVHRFGVTAHHKAVNALDEVGVVAERPGLFACAENSDRLVLESLAEEGRHHAAIVEPHSGAVRVENSYDTGVDIVFTL